LFILAKLSLANRAVVALITLIVGVFGFLSVGSLKQELIPSIEIPSAAIVTSYPGAAPEVVDAQVSRLIENAVIGLQDLESTTVTSTTGLSVIRISFAFGTSTAEANERINTALRSVEQTLPQGVSPRVISGSFDSIPIIALAISSNTGDNEAISELLADVAPALFRQVDGIRDVAVSGGKTKQVSLNLDQAALARNGLSARDISSALQSSGLVLPVGSLNDQDGSIAIQIGSAVDTIAKFEALPLISPIAGSGVLTIGDVATVSYEDSPVTSIARTNGLESLAVAITKTPDGNAVAVSNGVQALVPDLIAQLGGDVEVNTVFDQAPFIEKSIEDLTIEGLLGLTMAILVILVFLFSVKSTLITAISIPTSLLIAFIGLSVADYSLNILTLGALTIAIGRVVDDSIVVIENINRHLAYGEKRKKAVITAVKEVAGAITASTITSVAVFLPIALVSGLIGELFRPFAFTVAIALLASLLVSLTIVPVLAYWFLRTPKRLVLAKAQDPKNFGEKQRVIEEEREKKSFLQRGYIPILNGTRRHPWLVITASVLLLGFTVALIPQLKTNFIDGGGSNQFNARLEMPASATLQEEDEAAKILESQILGIEGVEVVQTTIGSAADGRVAFGASPTGVAMNVIADEDFDVELIKTQVLRLEAPQDSEITVSSGGGFGSSETVDIRILASDESKLQEAVNQIASQMRDIPNITSVTTTLEADERVLEIIVDRVRAAEVGLTETQITGIVASALRPSSLGQLNVEGKDTQVYVTGQTTPETISDIRALLIPSQEGFLALSSLASVQEVLKPTSITSERGDRTATVSLAPEGDDLGTISEAVTERLATIELPVGIEASIGGAAADQAESFAQLGLALLAAIAIVYIVMVATFGSLIQPLLLLISIPFAATGALGLLLITDTPLGVPALIGMLMLIGIVVTNAIVLIDLVNQYRKRGFSVQESLFNGSRQRLRPILMTALATIFALTPMAFGLTGGSGFISQPLAIVVIGGLFSSTLLTLVLVPTLYWLVEGRKERKTIRVERREVKAITKFESSATVSGQSATPKPADSLPESSIPSAPNAPNPYSTVVPTTLAEYEEQQRQSASQPQAESQDADTLPTPKIIEDASLPWSEQNDEVVLDGESQMAWSEPASSQAPIPATSEAMPEFLQEPQDSTETPRPPTKKEFRAAQKQEKAEIKAQKKSAKESRHSED
jgi:HAE1 family hydrophobic/amphiphilic exporter-1